MFRGRVRIRRKKMRVLTLNSSSTLILAATPSAIAESMILRRMLLSLLSSFPTTSPSYSPSGSQR